MSVRFDLINKIDSIQSELQRKYAGVILSQGATLYIKGAAGTGKSAVLRELAKSLDMQVIVLVISQVDEADLGIYPETYDYIPDDEPNAKPVRCFRYLPAEWAIKASQQPTLVIFEELNRSTIEKRNACLQILTEWRVGQYLMNKENVFFAASGNIGNEDGNDVDEFDNAMINRLCIMNQISNYQLWKSEFGDANVSSVLMDYLDSTGGSVIHDQAHVKNNTANRTPYATERSWSNLSEYIVSIHHTDPTDPKSPIKDKGKLIYELDNNGIAHGYIGNNAIKFISYLKNSNDVSVDNILNDFDLVRKSIRKLEQSDATSIIYDLGKLDIGALKESQIMNIFAFLDLMPSKDLRATYIKDVFMKCIDEHGMKLTFINDRPSYFKPQFISNFKLFRDNNMELFKETIKGCNNDELGLTNTK